MEPRAQPPLAGHRRCAARGRRLIDLTASNPTTIGLTYESERILRALQHPRALEYEPASKGILAARQAVASYYAEQGIAAPPERLILTVSTSEAYSYCFSLLCDPGDEVLVPSPSYPLFEFLAGIQDVRLVPYELVYDHGWQIEFESLRRNITARSRAIMVVHPNNPTGHFTRQWELDRLNALCAEQELALIADEVFLDYGLLDHGLKSNKSAGPPDICPPNKGVILSEAKDPYHLSKASFIEASRSLSGHRQAPSASPPILRRSPSPSADSPRFARCRKSRPRGSSPAAPMRSSRRRWNAST